MKDKKYFIGMYSLSLFLLVMEGYTLDEALSLMESNDCLKISQS